MKKTFIALVLSCFLVTAYGQDKKISIGARAGLNIANISNSGSGNITLGNSSASSKNTSKLLFHVGGYSEIKVNDFFSVQPELIFSMKGGGYESKSSSFGNSSEFTESLTLSYLEIPILARFNFGKGFNVIAGPHFGFLMGAKYKSKSVSTSGSTSTTVETESTDKDGLNSFEPGVNVGVGYQLENGLNFGVRWVRGFNSIYENSNYNRSNNVFQFTVGFSFL